MPISCEDCREQLSALLEENTTSPEIDAHLAACADCARELSMLRQVRAELRALPVMAAPLDLRARIQGELKHPLGAAVTHAGVVRAGATRNGGMPQAVPPVSARHGFLAGLRSFFSRPANVAWASGLALAAFCLLLVARPNPTPVVLAPPSGSMAQDEVTATDQKTSASRSGNVKVARLRDSTPAISAPTARQSPRDGNGPHVSTPSAAERAASRLPSRPQSNWASPQAAPPTTLDGSTRPRTAALARPNRATRQSPAAAPPASPTIRLKETRQPGRIEGLSMIGNGRAGNIKLKAPSHLDGYSSQPITPGFRHNLTAPKPAPLRPSYPLDEGPHFSRPLLVRLEWLPAEQRRERVARGGGLKFKDVEDEDTAQPATKALAKSALRAGASRAGGGNNLELTDKKETQGGSGGNFARRMPDREDAPGAMAARAPAIAAPAAAPAAPAPAAAATSETGARGATEQGPAGVVAAEPDSPNNQALLDAVTATTVTPGTTRDQAVNSARDKRDVGGLLESSTLAAPSILLRVGERREARLTVMPMRNLSRALVQVSTAPGLRLEGQTSGDGLRSIWFGTAQIGRPITIPLAFIAVSPGAQTLQISLREAGETTKLVAGDSQTLVVSVLPR
ncbi:MAG TPA: hypothetical protein VNA16_11065 [Abditibacteriaceae bacterium]|nr:hypothetical protein [Abditibacteriaceae bacterium]